MNECKVCGREISSYEICPEHVVILEFARACNGLFVKSAPDAPRVEFTAASNRYDAALKGIRAWGYGTSDSIVDEAIYRNRDY